MKYLKLFESEILFKEIEYPDNWKELVKKIQKIYLIIYLQYFYSYM